MSRGFLRVLATLALALRAKAQSCQNIGGNYYCEETSAITFANVGFSGTYNQITNMDSSSCQCASQPISFSGSLAPLNNEVFSMTFMMDLFF